jgi:hypothetical protein
MAQRRLGVKQVLIDGEVMDVKGGVSYSLGGDKLETVMGVDRPHGQKVTRIPAYLELTITDRSGLDLKKLTRLTDSTVMVDLENGKAVKFGHAFYAAEGKVSAEEGEIEARFECDPDNAEEV